MAAIIRVKRRIDEEPFNKFVLNCKKRKINEPEEENPTGSKEGTSTILKFAGTVKSQDENITQITRLSKEDAKEIVSKKRNPDIISKNREEMKLNSQTNRFKVVNCSRTLKEGEEEDVTIVDIEKQTTEEPVPGSSGQSQQSSAVKRKHDDQFVYDLYVPEEGQQTQIDDDLVENLLSVQPFDDLIYGTHRENGINDTWDSEESEDSNDENNWRNDYPDTEEEEDDESVGESDIRRAVGNMDLEGDRELSSDGETGDGFVYSIDAEAIGFEDDIDYCDVNRYGEAYARYKKRVINKTYNGGYDYDNSDDSDDGSDDDVEVDEDGNKKSEITSDLDELDNFDDSH